MFGFLALAPTPLSPPTPPAAVELVWEAPQECPSRADVESLYEALLTREPTGTGTLQAHAVVSRTVRGGWRLELTTRIGDYTDVRKFRGARCEDLAEAAATLFAFALEPALHEPEPPTPPDAEPKPDPKPDPPPPTPPVRVQAPPPESPDEPSPPPRRQRLFATVAVGPEFGSTPGATARIAAGAGFNWRWARFEADVAWLAPSATAPELNNARIQSVVGLVRGCGFPGGNTWRFPVCAGAEVGGTIARVDRGSGLETLSGVRAGPIISVAAIRRFERVGLFFAVEGLGAVVRTELRLANDVIYTPANGSVRVLAGLEISFF